MGFNHRFSWYIHFRGLNPNIWVNCHISLTWIVRPMPFGDDFLYKNHDSRVRENDMRSFFQFYPVICLICPRFFCGFSIPQMFHGKKHTPPSFQSRAPVRPFLVSCDGSRPGDTDIMGVFVGTLRHPEKNLAVTDYIYICIYIYDSIWLYNYGFSRQFFMLHSPFFAADPCLFQGSGIVVHPWPKRRFGRIDDTNELDQLGFGALKQTLWLCQNSYWKWP